jgi:tetraacyldisaccharide 4'-kinase
MVRNVLEKFYEWGLRLDKKLKKTTRLPAFVVSVGNLSVGGRGKTPLVIDLIRFFQKKGFEPVVLTRGYGRKSKYPIEIEDSSTVEEVGDEPFEIYLKTRAKVLVGAKRAENALAYCQRNFHSPKNSSVKIFILDDGFQHWGLERDLDVVLVNELDFKDKLLPTGRLRELPSALERADLVLNLDRDCFKKTTFEDRSKFFSNNDTKENLKNRTMALTTRAGGQAKYFEELSEILDFPVQRKELRDHLSVDHFRKEILGLPLEVDLLILGMKEAVKLFSMKELLEKKGVLSLGLSQRSFRVYLAGLELDWDVSKFQKLFEEKFKWEVRL